MAVIRITTIKARWRDTEEGGGGILMPTKWRLGSV